MSFPVKIEMEEAHQPLPYEFAAGLPGAEAGTPDQCRAYLVTLLREIAGYAESDEEWIDASDADVLAEFDPWDTLRKVRVRLAALTSEVRALREDKARLDAIESGEVEIECMGTTVPYQWAHGPGGDHVAIRLDRNPKTLREAIDAARLASPSPTGAPAEQQKHEG